jgi:hypothetical protein
MAQDGALFRVPTDSGKSPKKTQVINAGNAVQRVAGAPDGRSANVQFATPQEQFGSGLEILTDVGKLLTSQAIEIQNAEIKKQKAIAASEEVEVDLRIKEADAKLGELAGQVDTRTFTGEGLSPLDKYRQDSQALIDKQLQQAEKENASDTFKTSLSNKLKSKLITHNTAVASTLQDLKIAEFETITEGDYNNAAINNKDDMVMWLQNNAAIHEERKLVLGEAKANALKKSADADALTSIANARFAIGDLDGAEEALNDSFVAAALPRSERSAFMKKLAETRFNKAVAAEVKANTNEAGFFKTGGDGSLIDIRTNKKVPGSEDPKASRIEHASGIWVKNEQTNKWDLIEGSKPASEQTDQEKRDETKKFLTDSGVLFTPDLALRLANLEPKELSAFSQSVAILKNIQDPEVRQSALEGLALGLKVSETEQQVQTLKAIPFTDTWTPEMLERALAAVGTGGADISTPQEKGENKGLENIAQAKTEKAGGLPGLKGEAAGQQDIAEAETKSAAKFAEPFVVDSKATNSIKALAKEYVTLVSRNGNVQLIDGGAQLLGQIVNDAEQILLDGDASTIGQATWLAFNSLSDQQRAGMERVTGLSQVKEMLGVADTPGEEADDATLNSDAVNVELDNAKAMSDIENLGLENIEGLSISNATGIKSALRALAGATIGQVFEGAENREVTKSRLMLSLIARDVVRMISLSPRFAVKEQELIQSMFPGPEIFNSPRQALNKIRTMQSVIDSKLKKIMLDLGRQPAFDKESELVGEASQLIEIKGRMNMFTFDLIPIGDVKNAKDVTKLGVERSQKFWNSLSAVEKKNLPRSAKEAIFLNKQKQNKKRK